MRSAKAHALETWQYAIFGLGIIKLVLLFVVDIFSEAEYLR